MKSKQNTEVAPVVGQHTTGEWHETPAGGIAADGEIIIAGTHASIEAGGGVFNNGFGNAKANRAIICRAVNSHAALLEALKAIHFHLGGTATASITDARLIAARAIEKVESANG